MSEESKKDKSHSTPPRPTAPQVETKAVIYIGPAMVEGDFQIQYGAIYSNGLPDNVKERMEKDSDFAKLFIPIGDAPKAMTELMNRDSDLSSTKMKVSRGYIERKTRKRGK